MSAAVQPVNTPVTVPAPHQYYSCILSTQVQRYSKRWTQKDFCLYTDSLFAQTGDSNEQMFFLVEG